MAIAKKLTITTTKQDLLAGLADDVYEVLFWDIDTANFYITHDNGASSSDSIQLTTAGIDGPNGKSLKLLWDSTVPLYAFTDSGTSTLFYMVGKAASSSVNLSVGPCS